MLVAGIDQGTTSTKGVLLGADGIVAPLPGRAHAQDFPHAGWVEQQAPELLANVTASIEAAVAAGARVVGIANQGETVGAWDRDTGEPLAPAIVWQDQRTAPEIARMAADGLAAEVTARSGLPLDSYFSASKLRWLLDHAPGARTLAGKGRLGLGTSDSYFIERLTGRYATDATTAARTSLMHLADCTWDPTLCELFGVPIEALPEIVDDRQPIGDVATACGPATLCAGVVDQVATLYGHGCRRPGSGKVTIGTGAFALILASDGRPEAAPPGSVLTAAWPRRNGRAYAAEGGVYSAAAAIDWLLRIGVLRDHAELAALDGDRAARTGIFFVPALSGLAFPHWDRSAAGLFIGLDAGTTRETMIKAVLEGIAFRIAEVLDGLGFAPGAPVPVDGGLARSPWFIRALADFSGHPLRVRDGIELTALGVAQLAAAVATGTDAADYRPLTDEAPPPVQPMLDPDTALSLRQRFTEARGRAQGWRR